MIMDYNLCSLRKKGVLCMINANFYCDIQNKDGETIQKDFGFDKGTFESQEELKKYMSNCNYKIGEPCAYWGDDVGILKAVILSK